VGFRNTREKRQIQRSVQKVVRQITANLLVSVTLRFGEREPKRQHISDEIGICVRRLPTCSMISEFWLADLERLTARSACRSDSLAWAAYTHPQLCRDISTLADKEFVAKLFVKMTDLFA